MIFRVIDASQDIEDGKYRVIVASPEQVMKPGGGFEKLFKQPRFRSQIMSVIFDEAHCISAWGEFRPEYKEVGRLRYMLPDNVPFAIASATLPSIVLSDIMDTLQMRSNNLHKIQRSNDRPNVNLVVRQLKYAASSFKDLSFLIPEGWKLGDPQPKPFVIFFDNKGDAVQSIKYLRRRLPREYRTKIKWFLSDMTTMYKEDAVDKLRSGDVWGICATDAFGMVNKSLCHNDNVLNIIVLGC